MNMEPRKISMQMEIWNIVATTAFAFWILQLSIDNRQNMILTALMAIRK